MEIDFTELLRILVGPGKQCFMMHKNLICARSAFFKAATAKKWASGGGQDIELPEDDPATFATYLNCVQQSWFFPRVTAAEGENFRYLIDVYVLADKLWDVQTANLAVDEIIRRSDTICRLPVVSEINEAFLGRADKSPLRRLLVDYYIYEKDPDIVTEDVEKMPHAFLCAVFSEYARIKAEEGDELVKKACAMSLSHQMPNCYYHQHDETYPAERCVSRKD